MKKILFLIPILMFYFVATNAQRDDMKWSLGWNYSAVIFGDSEIKKVKDRNNTQFPGLQVSRRIYKNISVDLIYTYAMVEGILAKSAFPYSSIDAYLRYDIPELFFNIYPFAGIGLGYIAGASTTPDPQQASLSLNFTGGAILWVSKKFGLTGRIIYKKVPSNSVSMSSHIQLLTGVIFNLELDSKLGNRRKRIWDQKH